VSRLPYPSDLPEDVRRVESQLLGPGGIFELVDDTVMGERIQVVKNRARSLREMLVTSLNHGDAEYAAFTDDAEHYRRFSYGEHARLVASTAAVLRDEYGVGPGDRVAILGANCPEWIVTFWATVALGGIAVGLNGWWTEPEIRYGVEDSEPKVLVGDAKRMARVRGVDLGVPTVVMEDGFDALWHAHGDAPLPDQPIAEDDPAVILYTSGTTGRPKGAINTHRNVIAFITSNFISGARSMMLAPPAPPDAPPPPPNCSMVTSPLFHVSGLHAAAVMAVAAGMRTVWLTGKFDPVVAMRVIESERVTAWGFTGTVLYRFITHPDIERYDLSSLRTLGGGGSPIAPSLQERAKQVLPQLRKTMAIGYGSTETAALLTSNTGEEYDAHPDSVGRPNATVELEIRDELGDPVPVGQEGEVCARGPMIMPGYWRRPEDTAATFWPGRWLRTGDIGWIDDGRLYLASRKRDLIFRGGENVYPIEIEHRLEAHPGVLEVAVVGVDHPELGQEVKAYVVPVEGATLTAEELGAWCGEALAYYKVPTHWEIREAPLPRNATGKIVKAALADPSLHTFVDEE
jgi:acyl-CoA synthetase (AMP-forming)/AMP-acid ligase II